MMQLLCNGQRLDLYEDSSLQFTKKNPLFAFDELSAERTTSFKLPATPTNDRVLACARVPAYKGDGMRKLFSAELQAGTIVKRGYLYVKSYSKGDYDAVMVCDMLFDLKAFGNYEWGSLIWNARVSDTIYAANAADIPTMARIKYHRPTGDGVQPAINIGKVLQQLDEQGILPIKGVTNTDLWLIRAGDNRRLDQVLNVIASAPDGDDLNIANSQGLFELYPMPTDDGAGHGYINALYIDRYGLTMTFADDTPENVCLCGSDNTSPYHKVEFLATRKFLRPLTSGGAVRYEGQPLAGQTISVPAYKQFVLMTGSSTPYNEDPSSPIDWVDLDMRLETAVNVKVRVSGDGFMYYYSSQLTDLKIGDVLKMYSAFTGTLIGLDADNNIRFFDTITPTDKPIALIDIDNVQRSFGDWAQNNYVKCKESDNVFETERKWVNYRIYNDNIEEEKDLMVLECIEGGHYDAADTIIIRTTEGGLLKENAAAKTGTEEYLERISMVKNMSMQDICEASTTVKVKARMSLAEFSDITSATSFIVKNTRYIWVDAKWDKNTADFTLARLE